MSLNINRFANIYGISAIAIIGILAFGATTLTNSESVGSSETLQNIDATVYKSTNCGCCGAWAQYAEGQGMNIEVKEVGNMNQVKREQGVPSELGSCHTTVMDDYVVEGHVPAEAIEKLLEGDSDVQGIGLPGMPQGSPGMPGPKQGSWDISSFTENGETSEFMTV